MSSYLHQTHLKFYVRPSVGAWLSTCLVIPCFHLPLDVFSFVSRTRLGLPHPLALNLTHCICGSSLDPMGIHLHCCAHGGERMSFGIFLHMLQEMQDFMFYRSKPTFFCCLFFNFLISGSTLFYQLRAFTLVDVVTIDPTWANLLSRTAHSNEVVVTLATQMKEGYYCDRYPVDVFFPLTIEVFGFFTNRFTISFINVLTWCGQQRAPKAFLYWCCIQFINRECWWCYKKAQIASISKQDVTIRVRLGLEFYWVYIPLSLVDKLHANGGRFGS
jgi:hypothetical protein